MKIGSMTIEEKTEKLYNQIFTKWISGNDLKFTTWKESDIQKGEMRHRIKSLLEKGFNVSTGYTCTSIRECHRPHIFYK